MPIISGFPAGGNAKFPEGGKTDQVLVKTEEGEAWGDVKSVSEKNTQNPVSFQVVGVDGEDFTIRFAEGGGSASSGVKSFNGRTGEVIPQRGDYTAEMVGADPAGSADSAISSANNYTDISIQNISSELSRISGELSSLFSTVMGIQSELSNLSYTANDALLKAEDALNRISAMGG